MEHLFARPELGVERNRGAIDWIGLDEDHPRPARPGDWLDRLDQRGRHAAPSKFLAYREVVELDFAALLLELDQLITRKAARQCAIDRCR